MASIARRLISTASGLLTRSCSSKESSLVKTTSFPVFRRLSSLQSQVSLLNCGATPAAQVLKFTKPTGLLSQCLRVFQQTSSINAQQVRTKVYCSRITGRPQNVKCVTQRFFRLGNGLWIRTRPGRNKGKYKKTGERLALLQRHVFCTRRQCQTLDKMATKTFKVRKHYLNDPYEIYHRHDMLPIFRTKARPFYP